jgi:hypothetical protein
MQISVVCCLLLTCFSVLVSCQIDCTGLPDGAYGHGCRSYTDCTGGVATIVDCGIGEAFNWNTAKCEPYATVPPPCGDTGNDCTGLADGRYAIRAWNCTYFYTCQGGIFFGTNPCNNPPDSGVLVFDEASQQCNWPYNVAPPCGTLSVKRQRRNKV